MKKMVHGLDFSNAKCRISEDFKFCIVYNIYIFNIKRLGEK